MVIRRIWGECRSDSTLCATKVAHEKRDEFRPDGSKPANLSSSVDDYSSGDEVSPVKMRRLSPAAQSCIWSDLLGEFRKIRTPNVPTSRQVSSGRPYRGLMKIAMRAYRDVAGIPAALSILDKDKTADKKFTTSGGEIPIEKSNVINKSPMSGAAFLD